MVRALHSVVSKVWLAQKDFACVCCVGMFTGFDAQVGADESAAMAHGSGLCVELGVVGF